MIEFNIVIFSDFKVCLTDVLARLLHVSIIFLMLVLEAILHLLELISQSDLILLNVILHVDQLLHHFIVWRRFLLDLLVVELTLRLSMLLLMHIALALVLTLTHVSGRVDPRVLCFSCLLGVIDLLQGELLSLICSLNLFTVTSFLGDDRIHRLLMYLVLVQHQLLCVIKMTVSCWYLLIHIYSIVLVSTCHLCALTNVLGISIFG